VNHQLQIVGKAGRRQGTFVMWTEVFGEMQGGRLWGCEEEGKPIDATA